MGGEPRDMLNEAGNEQKTHRCLGFIADFSTEIEI